MAGDGLNNGEIKNLEIPTVDLSEVQEKTVVLRDQMDDFEVDKIIEDKKTSMFGSAFTRPKREEIHVHSKILAYESYLIMSGKYEIDFYRKATHSFDVEDDVDEIIVGEGVFPVKSDSGAWDKFENKMKGGMGMKKKEVEMLVEEHASRVKESKIVLDHHGREIKDFPYKIDSKTIENYADRILEEHKDNIKEIESTPEEAVERLRVKLRGDIR